jgi:hypothetical protein
MDECACATNLNNENIKFACFKVVRCYAGWFNLDLVDVQAAYDISYAFPTPPSPIMSLQIKHVVNWSHRCLISLKLYGFDESVIPVHYVD